MLYTGIDHHKRYSVACTLDESGRKVAEARIEANDPQGFAAYFSRLGEPSLVLLEACWNWGPLHDLLEQTPGVAGVLLSHPAKNRIIAEAQNKNDRVDARALATLLRGNFFARVHVPCKEVRAQKNLVRQRLWLAKMRTRIRNRIHTVVDRHPGLPRPVFKDIFCKKGLAWLARVEMPRPDRQLLDDDLQLHATIESQVSVLEKRIQAGFTKNPAVARLQSLPGVGVVLAPVIALEIDDVSRFPDADKLCAYAGLVPTTHASGGRISHGPMLPFCNKWLKWAFIEAAWVAVGCSDYFGNLYRGHRRRGKGANNAITIIARRMAKIAWQLLSQERDYCVLPPARKTLSPVALVKD